MTGPEIEALGTMWALIKEIGLPLVVLFLVLRGILVPLKYYSEMKEDRDFWRTEALDLLSVNDRALTVATTVAKSKRRGTDTTDGRGT